MAGRITVAKSVLCSTHVYTASTMLAPEGKMQALDKIVRNFVWGGDDEGAVVKVAWWKCLRPREDGGLAILDLALHSKVLVSKFVWSILQDGASSPGAALLLQSLRHCVAFGKPSVHVELPWALLYGLRPFPHASPFLTGVLRAWDHVRVLFQLNDASVYHHSSPFLWIPLPPTHLPLAATVHARTQARWRRAAVLTLEDWYWDGQLASWELFRARFRLRGSDRAIWERVAGSIPLHIPIVLQDDAVVQIWKVHPDVVSSCFVRSCYRVLAIHDTLPPSGKWSLQLPGSRWRSVWTWTWSSLPPPKVRVLLWQVVHRCIRVNALVSRFRPGVSPLCPCCGLHRETVEHCLVLCPHLRAAWDWVRALFQVRLTSQQLLLHVYPSAWPLLRQQALHLCVAWLVWLIWKRRRLWIFQGIQQPATSLIPRLRYKLFQSFLVFPGLAERKFAIWRDFLGIVDADGQFVPQ
jgi:hypothetical protein